MTLVNLLLIALNTCHTARCKKEIPSKGIPHTENTQELELSIHHIGSTKKASQQAN